MSDKSFQEQVLGMMTSLTNEMATLRADVMGKLEQVNDRLTAIRDDISVNYNASGHVMTVHQHTRDELRSLTSLQIAMQKQILRMQTALDQLQQSKGAGA